MRGEGGGRVCGGGDAPANLLVIRIIIIPAAAAVLVLLPTHLEWQRSRWKRDRQSAISKFRSPCCCCPRCCWMRGQVRGPSPAVAAAIAAAIAAALAFIQQRRAVLAPVGWLCACGPCALDRGEALTTPQQRREVDLQLIRELWVHVQRAAVMYAQELFAGG